MKKIKHIQDLHAEQERLKQHQDGLKNKIAAQCRELWNALNPLNAARKLFFQLLKKKNH